MVTVSIIEAVGDAGGEAVSDYIIEVLYDTPGSLDSTLTGKC